MFDEYARQLIDKLPKLPNLSHDECRRALSKAYLLTLGPKFEINVDDLLKEELEEIKKFLRRLSNSLQSICVFDKLNGVNVSADTEEACAFVAAESISLLVRLIKDGEIENEDENWEETKTDDDAFSNIINFLSIESAMLYMIGGYDINALTLMKNIEDTKIDIKEIGGSTSKILSMLLVKSIKEICSGKLTGKQNYINVQSEISQINSYENLLGDIRNHFYEKLNYSICSYMMWLEGNVGAKNEAIETLEKIRHASINSGYEGYSEFADIYHFSSLFLVVIDKTSKRALAHAVPTPKFNSIEQEKQFQQYLTIRAKGNKKVKGRPFLWPSAIDYINGCLPGPEKSAVISMPTGSGKSFIAELAIVQSISRGWILYLAPTNALANQVRRDLKISLSPFKEVKIKAFVGGDEYTILSEEQIDDQMNYIAVMTPEKCALALRMYPEKFKKCSLCVFDECHLMNDHRRGMVVDILLSQLFSIASKMKFVLMSAMMDNAEELSEWLQSVTNIPTVPKQIKWRPSRTMRGLLLLDRKELFDEYKSAKKNLDSLPQSRKKIEFHSSLGMLVGLSGPWTNDGARDYKALRLPIKFASIANRTDDIPKIESWKNTSSRQLAERLAKNGVPVINFILSSKHHAFSAANKVIEGLPKSRKSKSDIPKLVRSWLNISDAELGIETIIWELLSKGIAVHTSGMLQAEQAAVEWMFCNSEVYLMFATGTLAQGLNLPAVAVIVSGTSMGDPREIADEDIGHGISRINALILNGFGRAGRPGFSNQGIGILVSDKPYADNINEQIDPKRALREYAVLTEADAAISIESPIERFINNILEGGIDLNYASEIELNLFSFLTELSDNKYSAGELLKSTFAGYKKRKIFSEDTVFEINKAFRKMKDNFITQYNVPKWITTATMKSGVDFFKARDMWFAYKKYGLICEEEMEIFNVIDWLNVFFNVISLMPPKRLENYIPDDTLKTKTVLTKIRDLIKDRRDSDSIDWNIPTGWHDVWMELKELVLAYMNGESYINIAKLYLRDKFVNNNKRSGGSQSIPAVFKFIKEIIEPLAIDAGCFLAINEYGIFDEDKELIPESLQALPMCIRNGCNSLETLAWFRFGIKQRKSAHVLQEEFPVPDDLKNDFQRARWVRKKRAHWLREETERGLLLESIKDVIINGQSI